MKDPETEEKRLTLLIQLTIIAVAVAVTVFVLCAVYSSQPLALYSIEVDQPGIIDMSSAEEVFVEEPVRELPAETSSDAPPGPTEVPVTSGAGAQEVLAEKSININTADVEELEKLPGIGPALASRIVEYRENNGGFYDIEELTMVNGIGEKTFEKLEPYIFA